MFGMVGAADTQSTNVLSGQREFWLWLWTPRPNVQDSWYSHGIEGGSTVSCAPCRAVEGSKLLRYSRWQHYRRRETSTPGGSTIDDVRPPRQVTALSTSWVVPATELRVSVWSRECWTNRHVIDLVTSGALLGCPNVCNWSCVVCRSGTPGVKGVNVNRTRSILDSR